MEQNINNSCPEYPSGTQYGLAYHGVLTLFGILRDIDPTRIYTKYASHPIKKDSRDLINKIFQEAGFTCIPLLISYKGNEPILEPVLNYLKGSDESNISVDYENSAFLKSNDDCTVDDNELDQIVDKSKFSYLSDIHIDESDSFTWINPVNVSCKNVDDIVPGSLGSLSYRYLESSTEAVKSAIFLHEKNLMCFYVAYDTFIQGYLYFNPENVKFSKHLYKVTAKEEKDNTYNTRVVIQNQGGLYIQIIKKEMIDSIKDINLYNYNEDFNINRLYQFIESEESGLIILHGEPGTGKTTIIKHLLMKYTETEKKIVYLPINLASNIDNPSLLSFFIEHPNVIYVIEDAEELIKSRESGNNKLAGFLNATDGILSSVLSVKFILTFNTKITTEHVDQALLRKGRLRYIYYFDKLKKHRASKLLGRDVKFDVFLADLYNQEDNNYQNKTAKIGF